MPQGMFQKRQVLAQIYAEIMRMPPQVVNAPGLRRRRQLVADSPQPQRLEPGQSFGIRAQKPAPRYIDRQAPAADLVTVVAAQPHIAIGKTERPLQYGP